MQGSINFDGTLSGSIAGGGGGGSEVTITPKLASGTEIAEYSIDGTTGKLYAPTPEDPPQLPVNIVTKVQRKYNDTTQTLIATVTTLDTESEASVSQDIYAPSPPIVNYIEEPGLSEDIQIGSLQVGGNSTPIYIPSSGGGGSWDYSTTEVATGQKWIDGIHEIYNLVIPFNTQLTSNTWIKVASITNEVLAIIDARAINTSNYDFINVVADFDENDGIYVNNRSTVAYTPSHIIVEYIKLS